MDYSSTLNLPATPFPMEANLLERQEAILRRWQAQDIYRILREARRDGEPFIIHDGPPYASGQVHVGIGLNKVLKDMVAKFQAMNGRQVSLVPGWDCHGFPIERRVLDEHDGSGESELSATEIRKRCERYARQYVDAQKRQFQLLGIFADWHRPYLTMAPSYEAGVLAVLRKMVELGYVYRDLRPLPWCPSCATALADAEVVERREEGRSHWIRFEGGEALASRCGVDGGDHCSALVWTPSPWSLPGTVALAIAGDREYSLVRQTDPDGTERIALVATDSLATLPEALDPSGEPSLATVSGAELEGLEVRHPLSGEAIPIVSAPFASAETGTGLAAVAPAHRLEHLEVARRHGLDVPCSIGPRGEFTDQAGELAGCGPEEGDRRILSVLRERGTLAASRDEELGSRHCRRCGSRIVHRATQQWFVSLEHRGQRDAAKTLRERALIEGEVTEWFPQASRERFRSMLRDRGDWCISRQRTWGVPLPALVCQSCETAILEPAVIERLRDQVAQKGGSIWYESSADDFRPPGLRCPSCGGERFEKGEDILDVWFESGSSWQPMLVADHRLEFPADLYLEGSDQHRGWFQLSLLPAVATRAEAPFKEVVTHGFVLNEDRRRMSRSRGDLVTLQQTLEEIPADLMRLFFASVDIESDIPLSLTSFRSVESHYRTFRNTFRFLLGNLSDFVPTEDSVHVDDLHPLDLWALCRFHELMGKVTQEFEGYRFHGAFHRLHEFCTGFLSSVYFDATKDRLYYEGTRSARRRSAQTVLHSILVGLVKLVAPILPYTSEEVWGFTPGHGSCASVHLSRWPQRDGDLCSAERSRQAEETYAGLDRLRRRLDAALEELRGDREIGASWDARVEIHVDGGLETLPGAATLEDLRSFLRVGEVRAAEGELPRDGDLPGVTFSVEPAPHPTCVRCRRRDKTVGDEAGHPGLCERCCRVVAHRYEPVPGPRVLEHRISPQTRPADLAAFLRSRDVRKVALLGEDGTCRPYALHPPSQEVRILEELEPLADYVARSPDFRDHAALLLGLGEHTDVLFGIGIHRLDYGTPLGGTRESGYGQVAELMDNLLRLSWGMSVKNSVAELPHGGGKSIIDTCGWDLKIHRELRREIYRDFGQFTASLFGRYICAEDVSNTKADTHDMLSACRHVMCLPETVGGSGNPSRFTALAAWAAAKAGWKFLEGTTSFEGLTIALQGCGNVGQNFVKILVESDPGIARLLVADRDPEKIQAVRNILLRHDREDLLEVASSKDPLADDPYVEREEEAGRDYVLYAPCDVLIPAALGNVIHPGNVDRLQCRLILPIANNVYSDNDEVAQRLGELGVIDVVENNVNWGGALAAASEILGYDETHVARACAGAYSRTLELLTTAQEEGRPPWELVKEAATRRIYEEVHPAIAASREYRFIGDISHGFAAWIKERWLSNLVGEDPEEFPGFAVKLAEEVADERLGS